MQKQQPSLLTILSLAFLLLFILGCSKKSSDPCSGINIVVSGTKIDNTANDGSISATASGSTGFTYKLDNGTFQASGDFNNLSAGTYTVTAKDAGGCSGSESFTIGNTKTYYLAKATWKFSTATVNGANVSAFLQGCQKDNTMVFQVNGDGTLDEGPTKCNAADPQSVPFTWSLTTNESVLHVSAILFTGGSSDFTLISVSDTQLVLSQVINLGGTNQTAVVTFIH